MPDYLPLNHIEFKEVFEALKTLPQFRECCCPNCETTFSYATIAVHVTCPSCGTSVKTRCFGGYEEIQDLILLVLDWLGSHNTRDTILKEFDSFEESGDLASWDEFFADD
jgi:ribosomal protein S27E